MDEKVIPGQFFPFEDTVAVNVASMIIRIEDIRTWMKILQLNYLTLGDRTAIFKSLVISLFDFSDSVKSLKEETALINLMDNNIKIQFENAYELFQHKHGGLKLLRDEWGAHHNLERMKTALKNTSTGDFAGTFLLSSTWDKVDLSFIWPTAALAMHKKEIDGELMPEHLDKYLKLINELHTASLDIFGPIMSAYYIYMERKQNK